MPEAIPAHVVTGPLGSGKTSAIAKLLGSKPVEQNWVVLLNEFSDAGIDTLTVASAARGAFDVRLVPGGCLCCAGEQDFRRNLQELVSVTRPDRIIIEPSGLGHPAGIIEELLGHESRGVLRLAGIVALVDPANLRDGGPLPGTDAYAQVEIADALALSKPDLADDADRTRFAALAASLYPAKVWSGPLQDGMIPPQAFDQRLLRPRQLQKHARPATHVAERHAARGAFQVPVAGSGLRSDVCHLGHRALSWIFPRSIEFSRGRLQSLLAAAGGDDDAASGGSRVARLKGVFRVGDDDWVLAQAGNRFFDLRPTSWRRDNRVELLVDDAEGFDAAGWDAAWLSCQRR